jgi:hypothetical protein
VFGVPTLSLYCKGHRLVIFRCAFDAVVDSDASCLDVTLTHLPRFSTRAQLGLVVASRCGAPEARGGGGSAGAGSRPGANAGAAGQGQPGSPSDHAALSAVIHVDGQPAELRLCQERAEDEPSGTGPAARAITAARAAQGSYAGPQSAEGSVGAQLLVLTGTSFAVRLRLHPAPAEVVAAARAEPAPPATVVETGVPLNFRSSAAIAAVRAAARSVAVFMLAFEDAVANQQELHGCNAYITEIAAVPP